MGVALVVALAAFAVLARAAAPLTLKDAPLTFSQLHGATYAFPSCRGVWLNRTQGRYVGCACDSAASAAAVNRTRFNASSLTSRLLNRAATHRRCDVCERGWKGANCSAPCAPLAEARRGGRAFLRVGFDATALAYDRDKERLLREALSTTSGAAVERIRFRAPEPSVGVAHPHSAIAGKHVWARVTQSQGMVLVAEFLFAPAEAAQVLPYQAMLRLVHMDRKALEARLGYRLTWLGIECMYVARGAGSDRAPFGETCAGHGSCDVNTGSCRCEIGFSGNATSGAEDCSWKEAAPTPPPAVPSELWLIVALVIGATCAVPAVCCVLTCYWKHRTRPFVAVAPEPEKATYNLPKLRALETAGRVKGIGQGYGGSAPRKPSQSERGAQARRVVAVQGASSAAVVPIRRARGSAPAPIAEELVVAG